MRLSEMLENFCMMHEENLLRKDYCITFYPVKDGFPDPINATQIFVKMTEAKAKELAELFERTNKGNKALRITIEIFEISEVEDV